MITRTGWIKFPTSSIPTECCEVGGFFRATVTGISGVADILLEIAAVNTSTTPYAGQQAVDFKFDFDDRVIEGKVPSLTQTHFDGSVVTCSIPSNPIVATLSPDGANLEGEGNEFSPLVIPGNGFLDKGTFTAPVTPSAPTSPAADPVDGQLHWEFWNDFLRIWKWEGDVPEWQLIQEHDYVRPDNVGLPAGLEAMVTDVLTNSFGLATFNLDASTGNIVNGPGPNVVLRKIYVGSNTITPIWTSEVGLPFDSDANLQAALNNIANNVPDAGNWTVAAGVITVQSEAYNYSHVELYDTVADDEGDIEFSAVSVPSPGDPDLRQVLGDFMLAIAEQANASSEETVQLIVEDDAAIAATGDKVGGFTWPVPASMNGWRLDSAHAFVGIPGNGGTCDLQIHNVTGGVDMLSTPITIDSGDYNSYAAATPPVVDVTADIVTKGDLIRFDRDAIHSITPSQGLSFYLVFKAT